jgi:translocation and assembly module TamA
VRADVREAPFHTLTLGGGVGIEPQRQEVRARLEWVDRNFLGGLRKLDFDNRLGYVVIPSLLDLLGNQSHSSSTGLAGYSKLTFTQPDLPLPRVDFTSSLRLDRDIQVGYYYESLTASVGLTRDWGRQLEITPTYNFQLLHFVPTSGVSEASDVRAPQLSISCPNGAATCFLRLSYLEQKITYDQRDNRIEPHEGYMALLDLQEGGGPGASFTYLRAEPELRGYLHPIRHLTVAARVQWGWMQSFAGQSGQVETTPVTQRFFGGGANDVRAYGSRLMAPVEVVCNDPKAGLGCDPNAARALPVGGNGLYEGSLEARYRLTQDLGLVTFLDAGEVTVNPLSFTAIDLAVAPGLGLRYFTSFGPVRLDLAYRLPSLGPDDGQLRLAPSQVVINYPPPGGGRFPLLHETYRFNFQFSIGEAF